MYYDLMKDAGVHEMLMKKAGAILARRACSRGELRNKLAKIAQISQVEDVLDSLDQLNLLNDMDYAYNFALCRVQQEGWGPAKVRDSLLRRHVAQETVESAMERIRKEVDYESVLAKCVRKYWGNRNLSRDWKEARKLILHLRQRGFDEDSIWSALKKIMPAALLQHLETGE